MRDKYLYFSISLLCSLWLIYVFSQNEVPVDTGDGLMHFFISQASWHNPNLFLDHWGKPLFILLSSSFAQIGFKGMFVFNLLCYLIIAWTGFTIAKKIKLNPYVTLLFPILLLNSYDFTYTLLAGLTEPLFNVFLILGLYCLVFRKWTYFALLISCLPFLRSEGQLIFIVGLLFLLVSRNFKQTLFLFLIPAVYFIAGFIISGDFWWYFTKSPYLYNNNIYGSGEWYHYLKHFRSFYGTIPVLITCIAFFSFIYFLGKKQWEKLYVYETVFVTISFFGIILTHSYLWYSGKFGALGLIRLATQGMPLFLLFSLYFFDQSISLFAAKLSSIRTSTFKIIIPLALLLLGSYIILFKNEYPLKQTAFDKRAELCSNYLSKNKQSYKQIHYHNPLIPFYLQWNPYIDTKKIHFYHAHSIETDFDTVIRKNDILVWDSHFGPQEFGLSYDKLTKLKQLKLLQSFFHKNENGQTEGFVIYKYE